MKVSTGECGWDVRLKTENLIFVVIEVSRCSIVDVLLSSRPIKNR